MEWMKANMSRKEIIYEDFAQVADFGLAKLVGRTNEDELLATRLVGTPGYLPPE